MSVHQYLPVGSIRRRPDARPLSDVDVTALMASIKTLGMMNPISCRVVGGGYEVLAGSHRLEAMTRLGEPEILATILDLDDDHAELAMIDENLCRAELSDAERAAQTARRKVLHEKLHPETRHGSPGVSRQVGDTRARAAESRRFTAETAAATGRSERAIQRDAERGEKIDPAVLATISASDAKHIKTGTYLDELKQVPRDEQAAKVERDRAAPPAPRARALKRPAHTPAKQTAPAPTPPDAFTQFIILVDRIETLRIADLVASAGRKRSVLGQRSSSLIDFASSIMEALDQ